MAIPAMIATVLARSLKLGRASALPTFTETKDIVVGITYPLRWLQSVTTAHTIATTVPATILRLKNRIKTTKKQLNLLI
jgi:hypothetical protein